MSENHAHAEGTVRDTRPGDSAGGVESTRINLAVLNASHERFRIIKTYAQGGLGVVSVAHDIELDRVVAVKEMRGGRPSDDDIQRFLLEARLTGQLDHPGIPPVYALGYFEDGRPFYAMRLVDGVTLRSAIKEFHAKFPSPDLSRQRSMQLRQLIGAVVSVCNTLRFAHSKGVLHRDIKPSNIMLGEYGETLLMDWGLAKSQKQSLPYSELEAKAHQNRKRLEDPEDTGTGSVMGTPHYMSPEQAIGDGESINQRSEVYSVGATLYSVLTGKPPFIGQTREEILEKVRRGDFVPPRNIDSRVPLELDAICMKAMALERGDRYADTGELATDIEHWLADESVSVYREPVSRRWQRFVKAHQASIAGMAVLMATCFVGLLIGTYLVSIEHREAVAAREDAQVAATLAQTVTEQSRDLISRTFVTTFNDLIRNVPGTGKTRLAVLNLFLDQFQSWCESEPDDFHNRHELAIALHERAKIYDELNENELAWADLLAALKILDALQHTPDPSLYGTSLLDRMHLLADIAWHLNDFQEDTQLCDAFAQRLCLIVERQGDNRTQTAIYQAQLAAAYTQLATAKKNRRETSQAFELMSLVSQIYESLLSPERVPELNAQLHGGVQAIKLYRVQCRIELAHLAATMGDRLSAATQAGQAELLIEEAQEGSPNNFVLWIAKQSNDLLKARLLFEADEQYACEDILRITRQLDYALSMRPSHRRLLQLQIDGLTMLAAFEMHRGQLDNAQLHSLTALALAKALENLTPNSRSSQRVMRVTREMVIDIAQQRGDIDTAQLQLADEWFF